MHLKINMIYCKNSKNWDTWNNYHNCPTIGTVGFYSAAWCSKDADRITNREDPDQTAPWGAVWSGSALFAQTYLSQYLKLLRYFFFLVYCPSGYEAKDLGTLNPYCSPCAIGYYKNNNFNIYGQCQECVGNYRTEFIASISDVNCTICKYSDWTIVMEDNS